MQKGKIPPFTASARPYADIKLTHCEQQWVPSVADLCSTCWWLRCHWTTAQSQISAHQQNHVANLYKTDGTKTRHPSKKSKQDLQFINIIRPHLMQCIYAAHCCRHCTFQWLLCLFLCVLYILAGSMTEFWQTEQTLTIHHLLSN